MYNFNYLFIYLCRFGSAGSLLLLRLCLHWGEQGLLSSYGVTASYCSDFYCEARALECVDSVVVAPGL